MSSADKFKIATNCLGEFAMGVNGFGISITSPKAVFSALWETIVIASSAADSPDISTDLSQDGRFLVVVGLFATYVFDLDIQQISLYRATVRNAHGIWCEETPIQGGEVLHFNGISTKHYYVQFPFASDVQFNKVWHLYEQRRLEQIGELKGAT